MALKYFNNLAYEEMGEDKDETILFLHPKLLSHWVWRRQMEEYSIYFSNYHCIFIDIAHHGESILEGKFSIESSSNQMIEFIMDLLDKKGQNKINIVAIGLGASIALEMLDKKEDLIDSIILSGLEIADMRENEEESILTRLAKTKAEFLNLKPDRFIVKAYLRYFGIKKDFYDDLEKSLDIPIKKEMNIAFESFNYTLPKGIKENRNILERKNILLIYGNKEDLDSAKSAIMLKRILINAKLLEINKGNHLWNIIDSKLFNRAIISFIENNEIIEDSRIRIM